MTFWPGRTIVYDPAFDAEIQRLGIKYPRLDEAMAGLEWALSNRPDEFPQVYGSKLRMARLREVAGVPCLRLWFTFDDSTVTVIFAEASEDDED